LKKEVKDEDEVMKGKSWNQEVKFSEHAKT